MKVLHLESGRHLYGGARQVGWLLRGLAAGGIDSVLVCPPGHPLATGAAAADVVELPMAGDFDLSLRGRLRHLIREFEPDIVHVHSRRGADSFGGRAARDAGVPTVLTRRVQSAEPGSWLRWKLRPYAAIVAISSAVELELLRCGIASECVRRIPSAVDTDALQPDRDARARLLERYGLPPDAQVGGMAAQFIARKGHDLLVPLVNRVRERVPRFTLLLFGQGPLRARCERQVRAAGLEQAIRFCGFADDWPQWLPGFDLLLHPARREGLGVVVLEAMSAGVTVVAARVGGIVDVIEPGVDGCLVPPDDVDAWTRSVVGLLQNPGQRERLAQAARSKVAADYTIRRMADAYTSLYDDLRKRHG